MHKTFDQLTPHDHEQAERLFAADAALQREAAEEAACLPVGVQMWIERPTPSGAMGRYLVALQLLDEAGNLAEFDAASTPVIVMGADRSTAERRLAEVTDALLKDIRSDGPISRAIAERFALSRASLCR